MEKWFKHFQGYVAFSAIVVGIVLWVFSTFATLNEAQAIKEEVSKKEESVRGYVDQRHEEVSRDLQEVKQTLDKLDRRSYEMLIILRK
jgi:hypothetical protein